jgi:erythromycin esterase
MNKCVTTGLAVLAALAATSLSLSSKSETPARAAEVTGSIGGRSAGPNDALQAWLSQNAVTVRSISAADEDFSDLEPLIDAIGTARVVQLGEPSHGAGSSFAAKVRLIKFLHQRMGFDVLVWESGMYGLQATQAGMRGEEDPVVAAQRGIFPMWSAAEEVRPLFEYVNASQGSARPIDMAGFDMQLTAPLSFARFASDLRAFVRAVRDLKVRSSASQLVDQVISAFERVNSIADALARSPSEAGSQYQLKKADMEGLDQASERLTSTIRSHRAAFEQVHAAREIELMERAIENIRDFGRNKYALYGPDRPLGRISSVAIENRRDSLNASNLRWLMESVYPGRKSIVWAHNAHVMNAYYAGDWRSAHVEPRSDRMKPSGVFLAGWLKDDVYTILTTAYEGSDGWATGGTVSPIPPASEGSLEWRIHWLGEPYVFLDIRALKQRPSHPMRNPQTMRIPKYDDSTLTDLTKVFDAIFFIDRMTPATRITEQ